MFRPSTTAHVSAVTVEAELEGVARQAAANQAAAKTLEKMISRSLAICSRAYRERRAVVRKKSARDSLHRGRDLFDLAPDPQQVAAPDLRDLFLGIAAAHELDRHVHRFPGAVEPLHAAAALGLRGHRAPV